MRGRACVEFDWRLLTSIDQSVVVLRVGSSGVVSALKFDCATTGGGAVGTVAHGHFAKRTDGGREQLLLWKDRVKEQERRASAHYGVGGMGPVQYIAFSDTNGLDRVGSKRQQNRLGELERVTNLYLSLGNIKGQVTENDLAASVGAATGDDEGLVTVGSSNHSSGLSGATNGTSLGTRTTTATRL